MPCLHLAQEDLGGSAGVLYRLCLCCGAVLLVTAEGRWVIPPVDPRDRSQEPATVAPPFSTYP